MVVPAFDDCFRVHLNRLISGTSILHLFSDSCYGQNKILFMIAM